MRACSRLLKDAPDSAGQRANRRAGAVHAAVGRPGLLTLLSLLVVACGGNDDVEQRVAANTFPQPASQGAKLLHRFCADCHAPAQPSTHKAVEWPNIVLRMQQHRISKGLIPMNEAQRQQLTAYLQRYAEDAQ